MRSYRQFCGVARAAEVLAERWAMLVVRDLLVAPLRFGELRDSLRAPSNILTTRLGDLEAAGVIERRPEPPPERGFRYHLTDYGRGLEPIVDALGLWGARRMDAPREGERVSDLSLAAGLRCGWTGDVRRRRTWQIRVAEASAWAVTGPNEFACGPGDAPEPADLVVAGHGLRRLLAATPAEDVTPTAGLATTPEGPSGVALLAEFSRAFVVPLDDHPA